MDIERVNAPQDVISYGPDFGNEFGIESGSGTIIFSGTLTEVAEFMDGQPIRVVEAR